MECGTVREIAKDGRFGLHDETTVSKSVLEFDRHSNLGGLARIGRTVYDPIAAATRRQGTKGTAETTTTASGTQSTQEEEEDAKFTTSSTSTNEASIAAKSADHPPRNTATYPFTFPEQGGFGR